MTRRKTASQAQPNPSLSFLFYCILLTRRVTSRILPARSGIQYYQSSLPNTKIVRLSFPPVPSRTSKIFSWSFSNSKTIWLSFDINKVPNVTSLPNTKSIRLSLAYSKSIRFSFSNPKSIRLPLVDEKIIVLIIFPWVHFFLNINQIGIIYPIVLNRTGWVMYVSCELSYLVPPYHPTHSYWP